MSEWAYSPTGISEMTQAYALVLKGLGRWADQAVGTGAPEIVPGWRS
jgi:hypothetical protein